MASIRPEIWIKQIRINITNVSRVNCFYFTLWVKNWSRSLKFSLMNQKTTFSHTNSLKNNHLKNQAIWLELVLTFVFNGSPSYVTKKVEFHMQIFFQEPKTNFFHSHWHLWRFHFCFKINFKHLLLVLHLYLKSIKRWCNGYHYYTTPSNKFKTLVLRRFKFCSRFSRDVWWWGSLRMVKLGKRTYHLALINHSAKQFISNIIMRNRMKSILVKILLY